MAPQALYVVHPCAAVYPLMPEWIIDINSVLATDPEWAGWELCWVEMDERNSFSVRDLIQQVARARGPVLIFNCAKADALAISRQRLGRRLIVTDIFPSDSTDLWEALCRLRQMHLEGEPRLPRKLVVAVLMVRKLIKGNHWGGANRKNFLYADELAKGRGLDETFRDVSPEIASLLSQHGLLQTKYGEGRKGRQKYALNPQLSSLLHQIAETTRFPERLEQLLFRDRLLASARCLESPYWDAPEPTEQRADEANQNEA